ncbi:MAG TPA: hypothetical protein VK976_02385 [Verrucomicrobiae bacterium]|jgi:hypothetical protein|nr:hypothetical protein [Verrucomicrobiae bacterium]
MFKATATRSLTVAVMFLFTGSLFAQHYAERDHTMFHRPAAPVPTQKHQPAASHTAGMTHRSGSATTAATHNHAGMPGSTGGPDSHGPATLQIPSGR